MERKIDSSMFESKFNKIFGTHPVTYHEIDKVVESIKKIREEAFDLFKEKEFYKAASFYKALLDHVIDYLNHVDDVEGKLSDVVYEFIRYFSESCRQADNIDKKDFFNQTLKMYIEEDLGFTDEITKLILNNIQSEKEKKYIVELIQEKLEAQSLSTYNHNKVIELLLKIYRKYNEHDKYIETCELFTDDRWERYIKPVEIYESIGEWEKALKVIEEGMKKQPQHDDIFKNKYDELKKMILGL